MRAETILICDDEPIVRRTMRALLERDYAIEEAGNAAEGIDLVRRVRPDLVLLDLMMPGSSGLTVLEGVRRDPKLAETLIVVVSAFASPADREVALAAGADGFLAKPFDVAELIETVEQLLASRRTRDM